MSLNLDFGLDINLAGAPYSTTWIEKYNNVRPWENICVEGCIKQIHKKKFVIQMPWNLSGIYKKVHSVDLANKIESPREYFRV